jgi:cell shape-determining protein MreD
VKFVPYFLDKSNSAIYFTSLFLKILIVMEFMTCGVHGTSSALQTAVKKLIFQLNHFFVLQALPCTLQAAVAEFLDSAVVFRS